MRKFLLPVKGSRHDKKAAEVAALLARESNGEVIVMHITGVEPVTPEQESGIRHIASKIEANFAVECRMMEAHGAPDIAGAILAEAAKGYSYVIMGAREDEMGGTKIVGSTSAFVMEKCPCPGIIVKDALPEEG
jgi:nucleotide-binding universal stress UspA family protein